MFTYLKTHSYF